MNKHNEMRMKMPMSCLRGLRGKQAECPVLGEWKNEQNDQMDLNGQD